MSNFNDSIKEVKTKSVQIHCGLWDTEIQLTAWTNGEGFDIQQTGKNGGMQHISLTYSEFDLIKKGRKLIDK